MTDRDKVGPISHAIYWLLAVEFQRDRVRLASQAAGGNNSPFRTTGRMEEHFFLVACNKARRWLDHIDRKIVTQAHLDRFNVLADSAQVVRNKREHDEEYFGASPKLEPLHADKTSGASAIRLMVGTSVTSYSRGRIILGGIVDIDECAEAAVPLRSELQTHQRNYWRSRLSRLPMKDEVVDSYCSPDRLIDHG
jgi:hypothetical protein